MRVEPAVCRRKFEDEVRRLERHDELLKAWGIWPRRTPSYPRVELVFVPRHSLRLTLSVMQPGTAGRAPSPGFASLDLPSLAARAFGVEISLDDFDIRAMSVKFRDPWTWEPLAFPSMLRALHAGTGGPPISVLLDSHPDTKEPFLCMRGVREYHEHPQHTGDDWMLYRGSIGLFAVVSTVWRTCVGTPRPNVILPPGGPVQVRFEPMGG